MWRDIESDPPEFGEYVIVSDGTVSREVYRNVSNEYIRHGSYNIADLGVRPIKWMEIPIWEGEDV